MPLSESELRSARKYHATHREKRRLYSARYRIEHPEWKQKARNRLVQLKSAPCMDCGGTFPPECMDFDHVRGTKSFNVGENFYISEEKLLAEVAKCDLVCANCHRIRTVKTKRLQAQEAIKGRTRP